MNQEIVLRVAANVSAYPKGVTPIAGRTVTLIAYRGVAIDDDKSFQWKFRTAGSSGAFVDIDGATLWTHDIKNYNQTTMAGSYKCTVMFRDGTTKDTDTVAIGGQVIEPADTNTNKYHTAPKRYRGPWYRTHAHWKDIDKLVAHSRDMSLNNTQKFQNALLIDPELAYIYDLINRYGYIQLVDSRNGYSYFVNEETTGSRGGIPVHGPFRNFWEPVGP